ncbi:hypothetical protein Tco_0836388 [Tanacetum coccineum]
MMNALEESQGINLAWVIADHLCKHAPGLKENSLICGGYYVTKIAHSLWYLNEEEVAKCSEPIEYEIWTAEIGDHYGSHGDGYRTGSIVPSSGYEIGGSSAGFHRDDNFDPIVHSEDCVASDDDDMRD